MKRATVAVLAGDQVAASVLVDRPRSQAPHGRIAARDHAAGADALQRIGVRRFSTLRTKRVNATSSRM